VRKRFFIVITFESIDSRDVLPPPPFYFFFRVSESQNRHDRRCGKKRQNVRMQKVNGHFLHVTKVRLR